MLDTGYCLLSTAFNSSFIIPHSSFPVDFPHALRDACGSTGSFLQTFTTRREAETTMARTKRRESSALSRRSFIGTGLLGGMAVVVGNSLIGPAASRAARSLTGGTSGADTKFDGEELTITDAQAALKSGKLS